MDSAIYDDYIKRRNEEWKGFAAVQNRPDSSKKAAAPVNRMYNREPSNYKMNVDNAYRYDGYVQHESQLGEDPITTVRTMRNNLRRQAIIDRESGRAVKERLCQEGIKELSLKENDLITLKKQHTDALMAGDMERAEKTRAQMNRVKEDAIRNNYMDLITDENQQRLEAQKRVDDMMDLRKQKGVRAYGIQSKWTKEVYDEEPKRSMTRPSSHVKRQASATRASSADRKKSATPTRQPSAERPSRVHSGVHHSGGRFVPDYLPVKERRARSAARSPEGTMAPPEPRRRSSPPPMMQRAPARVSSANLRNDVSHRFYYSYR